MKMPSLQEVSQGWYLLKEDLHFTVTVSQIHAISPPYARKAAKEVGVDTDEPLVITVPKGFLTDLASIPSLFHGLLPPDGEYAPAAIVHDFLYQLLVGEDATLSGRFQSVLGKFGADRVLLLAMRECGCSEALSTAFFNAVQLAGAKFYQHSSEAPEIEPVGMFNHVQDYSAIRRSESVAVPTDHFETVDKRAMSVSYPNCLRPFYISEVV